jgi:hypothetical protein
LEKPFGVRIVGYIALFGSIGLGMLAWITAVVAGIGWYGHTGIPTRVLWLSTSLAILALVGLILSIAILRGLSSKYLWYALLVYWVSLLVFFLARDLTNFENIARMITDIIVDILVLPPYIYSVSCIAYFLTKKPRQYFLKVGKTDHANQPNPTQNPINNF